LSEITLLRVKLKSGPGWPQYLLYGDMEDDNENDNKPSNIGLYILVGAAIAILLVMLISRLWYGN